VASSGGDLGLDLVPCLSRLAPGKARRDLAELATGPGEGLVKAAGLLLVQPLGVTEHDAPLLLKITFLAS
jgi:hypothetical protein